MKGTRAILARGLLLATSLGFAFLVGEFTVARLQPQNLSVWDNLRDGMTVHWPEADVYLPRFDQRIRTNQIGMRDRERTIKKPSGTRRIVVLGDSFMEALQVPLDEALPGLLERRLETTDGSSLEVVNLSVSGWGTDDELTYLERHGLELEPDGILLMMTLHNDLSDNALLEFHTLDEHGLVGRPAAAMPWPTYAIQKLKAFLAGHSQLYMLAYETSIRGRVQAGAAQLDQHVASLLRKDASPDLERAWALTYALLDEMSAVASRNHAWFAIGMIPLRVQIDDSAWNEMLATMGIDASLMERDGPQRRIREWADHRGVELIDLRADFVAAHRKNEGTTNESLYLVHDGHWGAAGHALAAEVVSRALVSADHGLREVHSGRRTALRVTQVQVPGDPHSIEPRQSEMRRAASQRSPLPLSRSISAPRMPRT